MDFDKAELALYEVLEKMPPFSRKTLVLVSSPSIDLQPLIDRLTDHKPDMFGTATQGSTTAHLNRIEIQSNLSVPGIQGCHQNALIKSFEMNSHLICL